eukprot:PhF_6_TR33581/c0_g1_i3/m.49006
MNPLQRLRSEIESQSELVTSALQDALSQIERFPQITLTTAVGVQEQLFTVLFVHFRKQLFDSFERYINASVSETLPSSGVEPTALVGFHYQRIQVLRRAFHMPPTPVVTVLATSPASISQTDLSGLLSLRCLLTANYIPHFSNVVVVASGSVMEDPSSLGIICPVVTHQWALDSIKEQRLMNPTEAKYNIATANSQFDLAVRRMEGCVQSQHHQNRNQQVPNKSSTTKTTEATRYVPKRVHEDDEVGIIQPREPTLQPIANPSSVVEFSHMERMTSTSSEAPKKISKRDLRGTAPGTALNVANNIRGTANTLSSVSTAVDTNPIINPNIRPHPAILNYGGMTAESQIVQYAHDIVADTTEVLRRRMEQRCFQFTSSAPVGSLLDAVTSLGAMFDVNPSYSARASHLVVCGDPHVATRSDKFLAFAVRGKWVVHERYLTESVAAGKWLDERPYETHTPSSKARVIRESGIRPFVGWTVLLALPRQLRLGMNSILKEGGCDVVYNTVDACDGTKVTHVLCDTKEVVIRMKDFAIPPQSAVTFRANVTCVTLQYIQYVAGCSTDSSSAVPENAVMKIED